METELINGIGDVLKASIQQRSGKGVMRKLDAESMENEKENLAAEPNLPTMKEAFPVTSNKPNIPNSSPNPPAHESTTQPERPSAGAESNDPMKPAANSSETIFHLLNRVLDR